MKKLILTTVVFSFLMSMVDSPLFGQYYQVSMDEKVLKSDFIVEGEILESESYEDNGRVFTSHKVKVLNAIYPLASPCEPTVADLENEHCLYIITRGGRTPEITEHWSEALQLSPKEVGMFFLASTSYPTLYSDLPNFEVYSEVQGYVRYGLDEKANFSGSEIYETYQNPDEGLIDKIYQILNVQYSTKSFVREDWELVYLLKKITFSGDTVSFDINVKSKWGNPFAIKELQLTLRYNDGFFGQNIFQNGNLAFAVPSDFDQEGLSLNTAQAATDEIQLSVVKSSINQTYVHIDEEYRKIASGRINLQGINLQEQPTFELLANSLQKIFDGLENQVDVDKSRTKIEQPTEPTCMLGNIDNIQPLNVGAGVFVQNSLVFDADQFGGIITITGCGFGDLDEANLSADIPNNNRVIFQTIVPNVAVTPFASDYLLWNDDMIRVRVPSIGYRVDMDGIHTANDQILFGLAADFGPVQVRTPVMNFVSAQNLVVEFVHWNDFNGDNINNHRSVRLRHKAFDHITTQNNNNGYEFFFTQAFIDNMPNGSQIETQDALDTWCVARANFEIVAAPVEEPDFAGIIDYGPLPAGFVADTRNTVLNNLIACENDDRPIRGLGVIFSNSANIIFYTDQAPNPAGTHDVQSVMLHEFGHNHALGHITDPNYIMFPVVDDVDRMLEPADISGGQHAVRTSEENIPCDAGGQQFNFSPMIPIAPCVNATKDVSSLQNPVAVQPNPSHGSFWVQSEKGQIDNIKVYDVLGSLLIVKDQIKSNGCEVRHELSPGLYYLTIQFGEVHSVTKTIVVL